MTTFRASLRPFVLALLLAASACSWNKTVINDEDFLARADEVVTGKTKVQELPRILGTTPITWLEAYDGRQVYVYTYGLS